MYFSLELKLKKENENDVTYTSFAKKKDKPYINYVLCAQKFINLSVDIVLVGYCFIKDGLCLPGNQKGGRLQTQTFAAIHFMSRCDT